MRQILAAARERRRDRERKHAGALIVVVGLGGRNARLPERSLGKLIRRVAPICAIAWQRYQPSGMVRARSKALVRLARRQACRLAAVHDRFPLRAEPALRFRERDDHPCLVAAARHRVRSAIDTFCADRLGVRHRSERRNHARRRDRQDQGMGGAAGAVRDPGRAAACRQYRRGGARDGEFRADAAAARQAAQGLAGRARLCDGRRARIASSTRRRLFDSVEAAIGDLNFVFATTARAHDQAKPVVDAGGGGADRRREGRGGRERRA